MLFLKIFYILLLIGLYLFSILYLPEFSFYILMTMLLLPLLLLVLAHLQSRRLRIRLELPAAPAYCGETIPCRLIFENTSRFPVSTVRIILSAVHITLQQTDSNSYSTAVPAGGTASFVVPIQAVHAGRIQISVTRAIVMESLWLFRSKCRRLPSAACTVLPKLPQPPAASLFAAAKNGAEMKPTDSPEEFLGVREYRSGDRLRSVHWKLSSRTPEPIVREYGEPVCKPIAAALLYALSQPQAKDAGTRLDTMLEAIMAVAEAAFRSGHSLTLMLCYAQRYEVYTAVSAADLLPLLCRMLETPPDQNCDGCLEQLLRYGEGISCCVADTLSRTPHGITAFYAKDAPVGQNFPISAGTAAQTVYQQLDSGGDFHV